MPSTWYAAATQFVPSGVTASRLPPKSRIVGNVAKRHGPFRSQTWTVRSNSPAAITEPDQVDAKWRMA